MALGIGSGVEESHTVEYKDTAVEVGSGGLEVLATPILATWVEAAAYNLLESELDGSKTSVGSRLDLSHLAPTPVGMAVRVELTVKETDGRHYVFGFTASDERGKIAEGSHERVVVDKEKFMSKLK